MSSTLSEDWPQGSAEYLSTKLSGPDHSCPHPQKLKAGLRSKIPKRLGFFAVSGDDLSYIDTEKLCQQCYDQAVPNGFLAWSTTYRSSTLYHGFFPGQSQAGTERFGSGPRIEVFPQLQRCHAISGRNKVDQILGCGYYDPRLYESRSIPIPGHESLLAWRYLRRMKQPFYIDLLHLQPPWRGGLSKKDQRNEDLRVARNNGAAYLGAAGIVNAVPEGGNGAFTASEHRIAEIGSYRLISLGLFESDAAETQELDGQCSDAQSRRSFSIGISRAVPPKDSSTHKTDDLDLQARRLSSASGDVYTYTFYPPKRAIDTITKQAIGRKGKATQDESLRRTYINNEMQRRNRASQSSNPLSFFQKHWYRELGFRNLSKSLPRTGVGAIESQSSPVIVPLPHYPQIPPKVWSIRDLSHAAEPKTAGNRGDIYSLSLESDQPAFDFSHPRPEQGTTLVLRSDGYIVDPEKIASIMQSMANKELTIVTMLDERPLQADGRMKGLHTMVKQPRPMLEPMYDSSRKWAEETLQAAVSDGWEFNNSDTWADIRDAHEDFQNKVQLTDAEISWYKLLGSTQMRIQEIITLVLHIDTTISRHLVARVRAATRVYDSPIPLVPATWSFHISPDPKDWAHSHIQDALGHFDRSVQDIWKRCNPRLHQIVRDLQTLKHFPKPPNPEVEPNTLERLLLYLKIDIVTLASELFVIHKLTIADHRLLERLGQRVRWTFRRLDEFKQDLCSLKSLSAFLRYSRYRTESQLSDRDALLRHLVEIKLPAMERRSRETPAVRAALFDYGSDATSDSSSPTVEEIE